MSGDVALTGSLRTNLASLQNTTSLIDRTSERLSTGKEVNSVFDDPINFARSEGFNQRSSDLDQVLDNISLSKRTVEQAQNGAESVEQLVGEAESLLNQAEEELGQGNGLAKVTGNVDLRNIDDINNSGDFEAGDNLVIARTDSEGDDVQNTVSLNQNITGEEFVAQINALDGVNATTNDNGELEIEASEDGSPLRLVADDGGTTVDAEDIAQRLGLNQILQTESDSSGTDRLAVTVTEGTTLNSDQLTANMGDAVTRSTDIEALDQVVAGAGDQVQFKVFDDTGKELEASSALGIASGETTIQGLVDDLNDTSGTGNLIRAGFNEDSGEISITAIDNSVASIELDVTDGSTTADVDLNFAGFADRENGAAQSSTALDSEASQALRFGAAAGNLGQIEESFNTTLTQIDNAVGEAELSGTNLINGDNLQTFFNTERTESLTTQGVNFTSAGLGLEEANFASQDNVNNFRSDVIDAKNEVRGFNNRITTDLNVIQTRQDLAENTQDTLSAASDDLTLADQNEEAAKLSALQTRQQLANQSLSIAVQSQQSVLQILR